MKALLVGECREGKLLDSVYELIAFAEQLGAQKSLLLFVSEKEAPLTDAVVYVADTGPGREYAPDLHKQIIFAAMERENPDLVVFPHSSFGWDLAPRVAAPLKAPLVCGVVGIAGEGFQVELCNGKLRRSVKPKTGQTVLTIRSGAFTPPGEPSGTPRVERLQVPDVPSPLCFLGYEPVRDAEVDLTQSEVIVCAGRGVGKKENMEALAALAGALGGDLGATRPVVDAEWVGHGRQIGITGQIVAPRLYVACGVSGAIQHLAGMKNSGFVVAINKDKAAPVGDVADVLVVAEVMEVVPALTRKLLG